MHGKEYVVWHGFKYILWHGFRYILLAMKKECS